MPATNQAINELLKNSLQLVEQMEPSLVSIEKDIEAACAVAAEVVDATELLNYLSPVAALAAGYAAVNVQRSLIFQSANLAITQQELLSEEDKELVKTLEAKAIREKTKKTTRLFEQFHSHVKQVTDGLV